MLTGKEKLARDVVILSAMAAEMDAYLRSEVLFWHMSTSGMPLLTLGGYLMRQHRLLALRDLLDADQQAQVDTAVTQFNQTLGEKIVRFEQKAHRELDARLRQWGEFLNDLGRESGGNASNYETAVEVRVMIADLVDALTLAPYELEARIPERITLLDKQLRRYWRPGPFVWPEEWQPAYPKSVYWWLYGRPKARSG